MSSETKVLNIYEKICEIMGDLHYIQKEDKKVNNQYRFVSHDAVTAKIQPFLVKYKVVIIPTIINHVTETVIDNYKKELKFTTVTLKMTFMNAEDKDDSFETVSIGYGIDPQDKGIGKAFSYAYKYGVLKTFCLETGDDPEKDLIDVVQKQARPKPIPRGPRTETPTDCINNAEFDYILSRLDKSLDPDDTIKGVKEYYEGRFFHPRIEELPAIVEDRKKVLLLKKQEEQAEALEAENSQLDENYTNKIN